jgi:hypothetical protein
MARRVDSVYPSPVPQEVQLHEADKKTRMQASAASQRRAKIAEQQAAAVMLKVQRLQPHMGAQPTLIASSSSVTSPLDAGMPTELTPQGLCCSEASTDRRKSAAAVEGRPLPAATRAKTVKSSDHLSAAAPPQPSWATTKLWNIPTEQGSDALGLGQSSGTKKTVGWLGKQGYPHHTAPHERQGGWEDLQVTVYPSSQEGIQKGVRGEAHFRVGLDFSCHTSLCVSVTTVHMHMCKCTARTERSGGLLDALLCHQFSKIHKSLRCKSWTAGCATRSRTLVLPALWLLGLYAKSRQATPRLLWR